jgi:hypothetical protein
MNFQLTESEDTPREKPKTEVNCGNFRLFNSILNRQEDFKKELKLNKEIKKKINQVYQMFKNKFGVRFLNQKPQSLKIFESQLQPFLFSPNSNFLKRFPKLRRKIIREKKINERLLQEKIDIGAMIFYDLQGGNNKVSRTMSNQKEKILSISKNYKYKPNKDVVERGLYKTKVLDKNSKRLRKFIKKITNRLIIQNGGEVENNDSDSDYSENKRITNSSRSNINQLKLNSSRINEGGHKFKIRHESLLRKSIRLLGINKKKENNTSRDNNNNYYSPHNNTEYRYNKGNFLCSYTSNFPKKGKTLPTLKKNSHILSRNDGNNLPSNFNPYDTNITNLKSFNKNNNINMLNTDNNFHSKIIETEHLLLLNNNESNSCYKYNSQKKNKNKNWFSELRKTITKFKMNLNTKINNLNRYNNKCNNNLIKLIDINNDDNFKEKKKQIAARNKLDMKEILIDKKKVAQNQEEQILNKQCKPKDTVKDLIKSANFDAGENTLEYLDPSKNQKLLEKHINHLSDEEAFYLLEAIIKKETELDVRKIIKDEKKDKIKNEKILNIAREKAKKNYYKMIRLKNLIVQDRGKIFQLK